MHLLLLLLLLLAVNAAGCRAQMMTIDVVPPAWPDRSGAVGINRPPSGRRSSRKIAFDVSRRAMW